MGPPAIHSSSRHLPTASFLVESFTALASRRATAYSHRQARKIARPAQREGTIDDETNSGDLRLEGIEDARGLLIAFFEYAPAAFQIYRADGQCVLVNAAFRRLFGLAPPPEYNLLRDDVLERQGFLELVRRAFGGETVTVPPHWYDPRELRQLKVQGGRRVGIQAILTPLRSRKGAVEYLAICFEDVTAELELEARTAAMMESEERFRSTFEQAAVGIAHVAPDGRWIHVNRRLCAIVGYTREELLALTFQDITYPPDLDNDLAHMRQMLAGEIATYSIEKRYVRKEGGLVWIELTVSLIRHESGEPKYFISVVQDISTRRAAEEELGRTTESLEAEIQERIQAERALRAQNDATTNEEFLVESEARKAAILGAALDCIVTIDRGGLIVEFNPAAEWTFGYGRADIIGKPLVDLLIPPSLRERHREGFRRYLATGVGPILGKRIETLALRADGEEFPVELAIVPTRSRDTVFFTGYIRDLTERRRTAEALEASEARFRRLAESGIIGIIMTDTEGNIDDANDEFLRIVGFSRADVQSGDLRWTDITPAEWRAFDDLAIRELAATGVARPWEKEYVRKDGSRVPVVVGVVTLELPRCVAFVLDLSEQKRAEQARTIALAVAHRESMDRERAEVALRETEQQLRQSQKMEAIGSLTGRIAHDFNNLLTVILSYVQMIQRELPAGDPIRDDLAQVDRAGRRGGDLIRHLLAFSRQQVFQPKLVNLNDSVTSMMQMLPRILGEDIELSFVPAQHIGTVHLDPTQFDQVLLNLIINARDAMPRGGEVTIETADVKLERANESSDPDLAPGQYVVLTVSDTGMGMDRATQARIFEPFFTTKEKGKGTGLGLSTVHGIVKQSGGSVLVHSEPGKGARFEVYLPRTDVRPHPSDPPTPSQSPLDGSETILLVEDDEQVRAVMAAILRKNGYQVVPAASGEEALSASERFQGRIDVVLSDVVMPRMNGRQLWDQISRMRPKAKVLFMSGYGDDVSAHDGILTANVPLVQKPLMPDTLLRKLREVLASA
jgi:PAS domain S-box-containing protein